MVKPLDAQRGHNKLGDFQEMNNTQRLAEVILIYRDTIVTGTLEELLE